MQKAVNVAVAAVAFAVSVGCGESKQDVIVRYAAQCAQMRATLRTLHEQLDPRGSITQPVKRGDFAPPLPAYDEKAKTGNTEIIMEEQMQNPEAKPEIDLMLSQNLLRCLAWAGPNNPLVDSAKASAAGTIEQEFQRALNWDYLVVVRVAEYAKPQIVGDAFQGGVVALEVFVFRRTDSKLLGAFPVTATAADAVSYSYKANESKSDRAAVFVGSSVWQDARKKVAAGLRELTGGEFRVD